MWSDRPLYEQYKQDKDLPQAKTFGYTMKPTGAYPSETHMWYTTERNKMENGLQNEIDESQIFAALRGVKNKWFSLVSKHRKVFEPLKNKLDWVEIKKLVNKENGVR